MFLNCTRSFRFIQIRTSVVSALKNNPKIRKALDENSLRNTIRLLRDEIIKKDEEISRLNSQKSFMSVIDRIDTSIKVRFQDLNRKEDELIKFEKDLENREIAVMAREIKLNHR